MLNLNLEGNSRKTRQSARSGSGSEGSHSWNELKRDEMRALVRVTSATLDRILKDRNRNVHESILAAVRRRTRRWQLPRRAFPGIKTGPRSPDQKPTIGRVAHPGSGRQGAFGRGARRGIISARRRDDAYRRRSRDLENRPSESRFSDETPERSTGECSSMPIP